MFFQWDKNILHTKSTIDEDGCAQLAKTISCLQPTMMSLITDADHSTSTVAVATAEPRAGLSNVNMVHSPALTLSCPLFLNPAELSSPGNKQQMKI